MQAETALGRTGLWFAVLLISLIVIATAADRGFAAHATICLLYTSDAADE